MENQIVRFMIGKFRFVGIFVEPMGKSVMYDGPYTIETVYLRVTNEEGFVFTNQDLERMGLGADDVGALEIGSLCGRMREKIFLEYFSKGMPARQGLFNLLCAKVEGSGAVRVTFAITCHNSNSRG